KRLATGSGDNTAKLWDVTTGQELATLKGHAGTVGSVAFSPDGKRLATGSGDSTVKIWDMTTGRDITTLKGHKGAVYSAVFSPDGKNLVSGSQDKTAQFWHAAKNREVSAIGRRAIELPNGWVAAGSHPQDYEMGIDLTASHSGKASGRIKSKDPDAGGFGTMSQMIKADEYRGKRVRFSGYVKGDGVSQYAGLWMRVDGPRYSLNFDNMWNRPILGTADWKKYEVVLDVPEDSLMLAFGINLAGRGQVWVDDLQLEIVGQDVPSTGLAVSAEMIREDFMRKDQAERKRIEEEWRSRAKNLPAKPVNLDFEGQHL